MIMKYKKCILLVDDKDQSDVIDSIKLQLRNNFDLEFILIRTSASEFKKENSEDLDLDKLINKIETEVKYKHIDVALTDFDLECDFFNGLDVVNLVHDIRKSIPFFIYSGNWDKVITSIVGSEYKLATIEQVVDGINKLIHGRIINCIGRTDYKQDLISYLKQENNESLEHRLCILLRSNGEMIFKSCYPEFKGKSFNEIADLIDNHSDARSDEWIEAILTQTISYLAEVNQ